MRDQLTKGILYSYSSEELRIKTLERFSDYCLFVLNWTCPFHSCLTNIQIIINDDDDDENSKFYFSSLLISFLRNSVQWPSISFNLFANLSIYFLK